MRRQGQHPGEEALALLAGGDLPLLARWRVKLHARKCEKCSRMVSAYQKQIEGISRLAGELDDAVWSRLEEDMRANIRLGLAAGEALPRERAANPLPASGWRWSVVAASMVFVVGVGVLLDRHATGPGRETAAAWVLPVVEAGRQGLALRRTNTALELMRPEGSESMRTVSWDGSARARYFDGETGQVTIHQVAWEESDAR